MRDEDNILLRTRHLRWCAGDKIVCPGCDQLIDRLFRHLHLAQHVTPATRRLIDRTAPPPIEDFYVFCVMNHFEIDGLNPKHRTVIRAIAEWMRYQKLD